MLKTSTIICWIIFTIIFVMALTMPGSTDGLKQFFAIEYEKLNIYKVTIILKKISLSKTFIVISAW